MIFHGVVRRLCIIYTLRFSRFAKNQIEMIITKNKKFNIAIRR